MTYCKNCGVELEKKMISCPLCGTTVGEKTVKEEQKLPLNSKKNEKPFSDYEDLTQKQLRKLFWELSGIVLISGILVTLIIDLILNNCMTWSKYSVTVCLVLFINSTLITFLRHRVMLLYAGSFISTSILLVLLDMYSLNIGWGVKFGIPLLFAFYFMALILKLLIRLCKQRGFNVMAIFFIAAGLFTVFIEGIISVNTIKTLYLRWSIIVMVCVIPIAAILFFIHYRLKKGVDLKKFFHI
ncbi:MAG: hypothetical protein JXK95_11060 [Bacteroidales bacterium]|nr:hypothetical protein [Bacteroidales bacterium]